MKLACGFEMLAANAGKSKSRVVREFAILLKDLGEDGDSALPTDEEMEQWDDCHRDDDEKWMDISYQDFERELDGKESHGTSKTNQGFGDPQTQAGLRKIVSRFEAFLNDETAGLDGAELEDMDMNDDDHDGDDDDEQGCSTDEDSEFEDKEVSFDEEAFSHMMRENDGPSRDGSSSICPCQRKERSGGSLRARERAGSRSNPVFKSSRLKWRLSSDSMERSSLMPPSKSNLLWTAKTRLPTWRGSTRVRLRMSVATTRSTLTITWPAICWRALKVRLAWLGQQGTSLG